MYLEWTHCFKYLCLFAESVNIYTLNLLFSPKHLDFIYFAQLLCRCLNAAPALFHTRNV